MVRTSDTNVLHYARFAAVPVRRPMRLAIRSLISSVVCLGLSAFSIGAALAQSDPQVGVWTLNVAKSTYSPGPAPKSATTRIEAAGMGTKVVADQVMAHGTKR